MRTKKKILQVMIAAFLLALLFLSRYMLPDPKGYLLFHSLAECFTICIALAVFFITWNSHSMIKNHYLLIVGIAYLFIGFLDFFHTLSYKGMAIFTDYDYYANQLWVAARYFESIVLLVSFLMAKSKKSVNVTLLLIIYTAVTTATVLTIFVWRVFPAAYVAGVGLTPFKKISEYIICAIVLAAIIVLRRNKACFEINVYRFLIISMVFTVLTELCFTEYASNYDFVNMLGHFFKIASFYFLYKAIIQTGIKEPYNLIFREMQLTHKQLCEQNQMLTNQTLADNLTIREHIALLGEQYKVLNRQSKLLDLSNEAIFVWDLNGNILYWNDGAEAVYGYTRGEALGQSSDALLKTVRPVSLEETRAILERKGTWVGKLVHQTKDGTKLLVESAHQLYTDEDGRKIVLELCRDVTEHNKLEADLRYRNMLLYAVIENMHDAMFVFDGQGSLTSVNARARAFYGDKFANEATVNNLFEFIQIYDLEHRPLPAEDYPARRAFRGESVVNARMIVESGDWSRFIEISATPITDSQDQVIAIVVNHHDITDLVRKQQEIEYQNNLLSTVLKNMHDALVIFDGDGNVTQVNARAREMYHVEPSSDKTMAEVVAHYRYFTMDRRRLATDEYPGARVRRGETVRNERFIMEGKDWSKYVETNAMPIIDEAGQLSAIVVFHHDITDLVKKQQAIEEHLIQLQQQNKILNRQAKLLDLSNEAIFAWYMDGPIIYWNQGAEKMYGYADDDAVGCMPRKLLNTRFSVGYDELSAELLKNGSWSGHIEHTTKDGRSLIIETRMQLIINDVGLNTVLETNRDVTEKIKAANAIRKSAVELENIINSTDDFIWSVDSDYRIVNCNRGVYDFTLQYYGVEFKPGLTFEDIFPAVNAAAFREFYERAKNEGEFHLDVHTFRGERSISYSFHPVYLDGKLIEITVFGRDITKRIKAEQEIIKLNTSLEARINERTKELKESLERIQNFTLMATHDLKTPLQEIGIYTKLIRDNIDIRENTDKITALCADMTSIISELTEYDRLSNAVLRREPVDIKNMIDAVFSELRTDKAVLEYQTGIPRVYADKTMIRRVVSNLLSNALKFSAMREKPKITVGCKKDKNDYAFYIKDNGIGIDMAYSGKLFNVFERLHDAGEFEGHGIGLASVRSIISKHGGRTWIQGKVNGGTTVYFTLPSESAEETECSQQ